MTQKYVLGMKWAKFISQILCALLCCFIPVCVFYDKRVLALVVTSLVVVYGFALDLIKYVVEEL